MAVLTTKLRDALSPKTFALPAQRKYPIPDKAHAANAKSRASQQYSAGRLTAGQKAEIDAKANRKLKG